MEDKRFILTRDIPKKECNWLDRNYKKGEIVFEYTGYTYGCISNTGKAFSDNYDLEPFFELPNNAVKRYGE